MSPDLCVPNIMSLGMCFKIAPLQIWRVCLFQRKNSRHFRCPVWKRKSLWYKQTYMNTEACNDANSIPESFEYFCQMSSKSSLRISSYTISKMVRFWDTVYACVRWLCQQFVAIFSCILQ